MNYLLDTHTFLWFINDDVSLSSAAKALIEDSENTIYLSVASIWEMAIKVSLDKLEMPSPFTDFIDEQLDENTIISLNMIPYKRPHIKSVYVKDMLAWIDVIEQEEQSDD